MPKPTDKQALEAAVVNFARQGGPLSELPHDVTMLCVCIAQHVVGHVAVLVEPGVPRETAIALFRHAADQLERQS